jgi:NTP pyrophosphatase (non-canonical NTP hydrolase)
MKDIIRAVQAVNRERHHSSLNRRIIKVMEELGEVSEAYLNVTSATNGKGKTWDDVREELADLAITALDTALTPMPDREDQDEDKIRADLELEVERKLQKWADFKRRSRP